MATQTALKGKKNLQFDGSHKPLQVSGCEGCGCVVVCVGGCMSAWCVGLRVCRSQVVLVCGAVGVWVGVSVDVWMCGCVGVLVCWCVGRWVCGCVGVEAAKLFELSDSLNC